MTDVFDDIESPEASEAAAKKLERLLSDDFTDFGIRMMHISEYENMIKEQKWMSKEIFWHGTNGEHYNYPSDLKHKKLHNFVDFLHTATDEGWVEASLKMTNWGGDMGAGSSALVGYEDMTRHLKQAHKIESESGLAKIRQRTLKRLSKTMKGIDSMGLPGLDRMLKAGTYSEENLTPTGETVVPIELLNRQRNAMQKLLDDPENLTKEELRLIYNESIKGYPSEKIYKLWDNFMSFAKARPYQVAVIFDTKAFDKPDPNAVDSNVLETTWGSLKTDIDNPLDAGGCILGAIVLLPNKGLEKDVLSLAKTNNRWAHPVIRSQGNILWPKKERVNS